MTISAEEDRVPNSVYYPSDAYRETAHIASFDQYKRMYKKSIDTPELFWQEIAQDFYFQSGPTGPFLSYNFDIRKGPIEIRWMEGAVTNMCYNVLDRNIERGLGDRTAFIWEGNEPNKSRSITYAELRTEVCKFANVLKQKSIGKGDRVAIYMPVTIELVISMLACARIGAVHSVVFAGFSGDSIADRILDCNCKVLVTCDGVFRGDKFVALKEMADQAIRICKSRNHLLNACIVYHHLKYSSKARVELDYVESEEDNCSENRAQQSNGVTLSPSSTCSASNTCNESSSSSSQTNPNTTNTTTTITNGTNAEIESQSPSHLIVTNSNDNSLSSTCDLNNGQQQDNHHHNNNGQFQHTLTLSNVNVNISNQQQQQSVANATLHTSLDDFETSGCPSSFNGHTLICDSCSSAGSSPQPAASDSGVESDEHKRSSSSSSSNPSSPLSAISANSTISTTPCSSPCPSLGQFSVEQETTEVIQASRADVDDEDDDDELDQINVRIPWNDQIDCWWHELMSKADENCDPTWVEAEHPLFILYTSGSTGKPKGVVHSTAGYMIYAATTFKYVFNYHGGDVFFCTADLGWITGHTVNCYGSLANAATIVLFDGTPFYPTPSRLWQMVAQHKVNTFYTAPTAIRSLMGFGEKWINDYDLSSLKLLGTAGEPINQEAWTWYHKVIGNSRCPIVDTFWQTETGAPVLTPLPGCTPLKPGSATLPFFGVQPALLDDEGRELQGAASGHLVFKCPWPAMMRTVDGNHHRFQSTYFYRFPGYYCTGDGARRDEDGYYWVTGRTDDLLNVSGHLMSTAQVEGAIAANDCVAEAAAVSTDHRVKGQCLYCFVVLKSGYEMNEQLESQLRTKVRNTIGAIAIPDVLQVSRALPKTRSGKIMRRLLKKIANFELEFGDISTLQDETVLEELTQARQRYPRLQ